MSFKALNWVFESSQSEGSNRLVMIVLAEAMNKHGDDAVETCWPSKATIASKARLSERTVQRCIQDLVELGELRSERHPDWQGRQDRCPNVYRFVRGDKATPRNERGDKYDTNGETATVERGDTVDSQTIREPQQEPQPASAAPLALVSGSSIPTDVSELEREFAHVWDEYPRKIDKAAAKAKYIARRRQGVEPGELFAATLRYAEVCREQGTERKFILHGATFFGPGERWKRYVLDGEQANRDEDKHYDENDEEISEIEWAAQNQGNFMRSEEARRWSGQ